MSGLLTHDWIERIGGAEMVLDAFAAQFPDAPIATVWDEAPGRYAPGRVHESALARTPLRGRKLPALPLMLATWRQLPFRDAEWMLCSSHLFAHHARVRGSADIPKFVYSHTPARYIWAPEWDPRGAGVLGRIAAPPLRALDKQRAQEAHRIAAVSRFIADRIERSWDRESTVIHPPVEVAGIVASADGRDLTDSDRAALARMPDTFLLGASRFIPYKRLDLVIAAGAAAGLPVVLAGDGPDRPRLEAIAADHPGLVTFAGRPSTALLRELYRRAQAFVFPAVEDFGIMPVEAMACGTGVVTSRLGGASETVVNGVSGSHLRSEDPNELRRAVEEAAAVDPDAARRRAWDFDGRTFGARIAAWMA
jgi:glycosyltransferase involved in cell wall biosynthesis